MKNLINRVFNTILILLSIIILGIFIPITISFFISILTPATFADCTISPPFWIVTLIGWITAAVYINDAVSEV